MSQPTHLTLAFRRPPGPQTDHGAAGRPEMSLSVTYRLEPGDTRLEGVIEAHAEELRAAFLTLYACLGRPAAPRPLPDLDSRPWDDRDPGRS